MLETIALKEVRLRTGVQLVPMTSTEDRNQKLNVLIVFQEIIAHQGQRIQFHAQQVISTQKLAKKWWKTACQSIQVTILMQAPVKQPHALQALIMNIQMVQA